MQRRRRESGHLLHFTRRGEDSFPLVLDDLIVLAGQCQEIYITVTIFSSFHQRPVQEFCSSKRVPFCLAGTTVSTLPLRRKISSPIVQTLTGISWIPLTGCIAA